MNQLTKSLLEDLLDIQKTVAIFGGSFKPPTKGHFDVVKSALYKYPEIDELKIFVGSGVRDGITQEESIQIWDIYKKYLLPKVDVEPSVAPVKSVLGYAKENPDIKVYWILGAREEEEGDLMDIENRTKTISKYPNLEVKIINTKGGISGTKTRNAVKNNNKDQFFQLIPDIEEKEQIWNVVFPVVKEETINEVGEANLKPYKWKEVDMNGWVTYTEFTTENGTEYKVDLTTTTYGYSSNNIKALEVEFSAKPKGAEGSSTNIVVNKGELYRVMATITAIIKHYVKKFKAKAIMYSPSKKSDEEDFGLQRDNLYKAFISKAIPGVTFKKNGGFIIAILPGNDVNEGIDPLEANTESKPLKKQQVSIVKENDPFGLNELARQFLKETLKETWRPEESFVSLCQYMIDNGMNIQPLPKIKVINNDVKNASNLLGKTAYYNPTDKSITLYTMDRHPKDILRSFSHEMIHHQQNLEGRLNNINTTNTREDGDLPEIEREAYEKGNMMLRGWEDSIKNS